MKPTMNLRFVEQDELFPHPSQPAVSVIRAVKVLQQQWESVDDKTGEIKTEWRNVPLAKDNT